MTSVLHRRHLLGAGAAMTAAALTRKAYAEERPAQPTTPPPPIEVYAASPLVDKIALSPDAKTIAIVSQSGDNKVLISFDVATKTLHSIGLGPAKIRRLFFADNDTVVLENSTTQSIYGRKRELYIARLIDLQTASLKTLFSSYDQFLSIVTGDLGRIKTADGYRVTASNVRMGGEYDICLYSFAADGGRGHEIAEGSNDTENFVLLPDGTPVAYAERNDERKTWTLHFNTAEPGKPPHFKQVYQVHQDLDTPSLEGLGRDGKSVVVYIYKGDAGGEYHEISADGVLSEPLDTDTEDKKGSDAIFHPTTHRLAGFMRHDDWFNYDWFDPLLKKLADAIPQAMGEDYRTYVGGYAEDPRKMLVYGEGEGDAGTWYFIDFSTGESVQVANNYSDLPPEWVTQKQSVKYKAGDGLTIPAYLTLPPFKDPKNLPLVVLPHGGPFDVRDYIDFDWQAQVLASRGYAVLQPNYRGSGGYTRDFGDAGKGEMGRKMQTDLSDGVRWLVDRGTVDPKRVAILGASYGGYAAMAGATLDPGVYRCAVAVAGLSDIHAWIDSITMDYGTRDAVQVRGWVDFLPDKALYDAISPAKQAAKASCPLLLIHGTDDTVVPIDQSRRMEKAMKAAGKAVEFVTYKGQDHWETIGSARIDMMKAAMAFLDKHNPATPA